MNRGNVLKNTRITRVGSNGVYLDDQMSGWLVTDNYIEGAKGARTGLELGGGRRNKVLRNKLSGFGLGVRLISLGGGAAVSAEMRARVAELLRPGSPWAAQYPELLNISDHAGFPVHTDISDNVYDSDIWMQTTEGPANGFNITTPKENAANLKAWLSTATNNTRV